jgi:hypothetical protein
MKTRKELAELLKFGIEDGDTDTVWYVVGELEKGEDQNVIALIKSRRIAYMTALDEAQNDMPIGDDEYYESDDYYETAIETLTNILKEIEGK